MRRHGARHLHKQKQPAFAGVFVIVEMAEIESASEKMYESESTVCSLLCDLSNRVYEANEITRHRVSLF